MHSFASCVSFCIVFLDGRCYNEKCALGRKTYVAHKVSRNGWKYSNENQIYCQGNTDDGNVI